MPMKPSGGLFSVFESVMMISLRIDQWGRSDERGMNRANPQAL